MTDSIPVQTLSLVSEPFENLQKTLLRSDASSLSSILPPYLPVLSNPASLFHSRATTVLDRNSLEAAVSRDPKYAHFRNPDAVHALVELSKNVPISVDSLLELFVKSHSLAMDQNVSLNHDAVNGISGTNVHCVYFDSYALALGFFRRELYCFTLVLEHLYTSFPSSLPKELTDQTAFKHLASFLVNLLKLLCTADLKHTRPVLVLSISALLRSLLGFALNTEPAVESADAFNSLLGLAPSLTASKFSLVSQGVTLSDADFVLNDHGVQSAQWRDLLSLVLLILGLNMRSSSTLLDAIRMHAQSAAVSGGGELMLSFWLGGIVYEDAKAFREGLVYGRVLETMHGKYSAVSGSLATLSGLAVERLLESLIFPVNERFVVLKQLDLFAFKHKLLSTADSLQCGVARLLQDVCLSEEVPMKRRAETVQKFASFMFDRMETVNANSATETSYVTTLNLLEKMLKVEAMTGGNVVHRKILVHHNPMFNFHKILQNGEFVGARTSQLRVLTRMAAAGGQSSTQFLAVTRLLTEILSSEQWGEDLRRTAVESLAELVELSEELSRNVMNIVTAVLAGLIIQGPVMAASLAQLFVNGFARLVAGSDRRSAAESVADTLEMASAEIFRSACTWFFADESLRKTADWRKLQLWTMRWLRSLLEIPLDAAVAQFAWRSVLMRDSALLSILVDALLHSNNTEIESAAVQVIDTLLRIYPTLDRSSAVVSTSLPLTEVLVDSSAGSSPVEDERLVQGLWGAMHKRHLLGTGLAVFEYLLTSDAVSARKFNALFSLFAGGGGGGLYRVFSATLRDVILGYFANSGDFRRVALACLEKAVLLDFEFGGGVLGLVRASTSDPVRGFVPDCVEGGGAIEALFCLLDNPPSASMVGTHAEADYAAAVRVLKAMVQQPGLTDIAMRYVKYAFVQRYQVLLRWTSSKNISDHGAEIVRGLMVMAAREFCEESDRGTAMAVAEGLLLSERVFVYDEFNCKWWGSVEWTGFICSAVRLLDPRSAVELVERILANSGHFLSSKAVLSLVLSLSELVQASDADTTQSGRAKRILERLFENKLNLAPETDFQLSIALLMDIFNLSVGDLRQTLSGVKFEELIDESIRSIAHGEDERASAVLSAWLETLVEEEAVQDVIALRWGRLLRSGRMSLVTAACRVCPEFAVRALEAGLVNEAGNLDLLVACMLSLPKENELILEIANAAISVRKSEFNTALLLKN